MMYETGIKTNLLEVMTAFVEFCQKSDANNEAWTLVRNDTDSFFGTTFKVKGIGASSFAYISFSYRKIVQGVTYKGWYDTEYLSEGYTHEHSDSTSSLTLSSKFGEEDIFANSGEFVAFSVHKQYDEGLWMVEQGGSFKPTGSDLRLLGLIGTAYSQSGFAGQGTHTPAPYPGIGLPLLTVSDSNIAGNNIIYYFTKNKNNATITINVQENWQSISFGLLDGVDYKTYRFPAYMCGGTTGLTNAGWVYVPYGGSYPTYTSGNVISLDIKSTCLSNGTMINSALFANTISNSLIMSSDGTWESFYNYKQDYSAVAYYTPSGPTPGWGFPLSNPTKNLGTANCIYPADTDFDAFTDIHDIFSQNYDISPLLLPVMAVRNKGELKHGVSGFIQNCYGVFSKKLKDGPVTISGKKYLIIPNGWAERLRYYPTYIGVYNQWENDLIVSLFEETTKNKFCRLAIRLED